MAFIKLPPITIGSVAIFEAKERLKAAGWNVVSSKQKMKQVICGSYAEMILKVGDWCETTGCGVIVADDPEHRLLGFVPCDDAHIDMGWTAPFLSGLVCPMFAIDWFSGQRRFEAAKFWIMESSGRAQFRSHAERCPSCQEALVNVVMSE